jgi:hypothetical protein
MQALLVLLLAVVCFGQNVDRIYFNYPTIPGPVTLVDYDIKTKQTTRVAQLNSAVPIANVGEINLVKAGPTSSRFL